MALKCLAILAFLAYCHADHHSRQKWMGSHGPSLGSGEKCGPQVLPHHIEEPKESADGYSLRRIRNDCTYKPGSPVKIMLSQEGNQPIEQLHLYARHEGDDSQHTVGAFHPCDQGMQVMNDHCIRNNDIITEMEPVTNDVQVTWIAPQKKFEQKPIYFLAVIMLKSADGIEREPVFLRSATIMPEISQFMDSSEEDSSEESGSSSSKSNGFKSGRGKGRGSKGGKSKKGSKSDDDDDGDSWEKPAPPYPHHEPDMPHPGSEPGIPPHMDPGFEHEMPPHMRPEEPMPLPGMEPGMVPPPEMEALAAQWEEDFKNSIQEDDVVQWMMQSTDEERQSWFEEWAKNYMRKLSGQHRELFLIWARKFKQALVDQFMEWANVDSKHKDQFMEWANAFKDHVSELGEDQLLKWILSSGNERSNTFREWAGMFKQELENPEHQAMFEQWMEKFEEKLSEHPEWFEELERKYLSTLSEEELQRWSELGEEVQKQTMEEWIGQLKEQFDDEEPGEWLKDIMRRFKGDKDDDRDSSEEDDRHESVWDGGSKEKHHNRGGEDYSDSAELMEMLESMYQRHSRWEEHNQEQNMCPETANYLKSGNAYWMEHDEDEDEDDYECWKMAVLIGIVVMLMAVCGSLCYLAMRRRKMAMMEMKDEKPQIAFENDLYTLSPGNLNSDAKPPVLTQVAEPMEKKVSLA